jgi:hypothetical protein
MSLSLVNGLSDELLIKLFLQQFPALIEELTQHEQSCVWAEVSARFEKTNMEEQSEDLADWDDVPTVYVKVEEPPSPTYDNYLLIMGILPMLGKSELQRMVEVMFPTYGDIRLVMARMQHKEEKNRRPHGPGDVSGRIPD